MATFRHSRPGRPVGTGWLENALAGRMAPGEWTVAEAAEECGTSRAAVSHTAGRMVKQGFLIRVRHGVYRHLTEEEWDARD